MSFNLTDGIVRIIKSDGTITGTGFVLTGEGLIATCAHVVKSTGVEPDGIVRLVFHHSSDEATALVEPEGWRDPKEEDIAILRLNGSLPEGVKPLPLGPSTDIAKHPFETFGFPDFNGSGGLIARGLILGQTTFNKMRVLQIRCQEVTGGFSGAPILDTDRQQIVGMVIATVDPDDRGRLGQTAFITPIEDVIAIWPTLKEYIQPVSPHTIHRILRVDFSLPSIYVPRPQQLAEVKAALLESSGQLALTSAIKMDALHGMGGIGKTVMARALCDDSEIQATFPDGILWTTLGREPNLVEELRKWVMALGGIVSETTPTLESLKGNLAELLENRTCLLVLDDVWKRKHVNAFRVGGTRCRLLVTTRDKEIALDADVHSIPSMSTTEAIALLEQWAKGALDEVDSNLKLEIVNKIGRLPLAIRLAGAQLQSKLPERWLEHFDVRKLKLKRPEERHDSLKQTFGLSLEMLDETERRLYTALAIFKEDKPIHEAAIIRLWSALDDFDEVEAEYLIDNLASLALLDITKKEHPRFVELHNLLYEFIKAEIDEPITLHQTLLDEYRGTQTGAGWHTAPDDGYLYDHLVYHLNQAGLYSEIGSLFDNSLWLKERYASSNSIRTILQDIEDAQLSLVELEDFERTLQLFLIEYSIITRLNSPFAPFELSLVSIQGDWETSLDRARGLPDANDRLMAMAGLISTAKLRDIDVEPEIFRELDELVQQASSDSLARAAMYVVIADYKRAFRWLVRVKPEPQYKWQSLDIAEDEDNRFAASLMLLRKYDLNLCIEACVFLEDLLFQGDEHFEGMQEPFHWKLPEWFSAQLEILLPKTIAMQDWRLIRLLPKAASSPALQRRVLKKFTTSVSKLDAVAVLELVDEIVRQLESFPKILLEKCIHHLANFLDQDLTSLIPRYDNSTWKDLLIEAIIHSGRKINLEKVDTLLEMVSNENLKLRLYSDLLSRSDQSPLEFLQTIYERALDLSIAINDTSAFKDCLHYEFEKLSQSFSLYELLEQIWERFYSLDKPELNVGLLIWTLDKDFSYGSKKLLREKVSNDLVSAIKSWLSDEGISLRNESKEILVIWIKEQIDHFNDDKVLEDLLDVLAHINPKEALKIASGKSERFDGRRRIIRTCGELAAIRNDLETVQKATDLIREREEIIRAYSTGVETNLARYLAKIEQTQPVFVRSYINQLTSETYQRDCWISIAKNYLPENLHESLVILGHITADNGLGIFIVSSRYPFGRKKLDTIMRLLDRGIYRFTIEETERMLQQLEQTSLSADDHDIILDKVLNHLLDDDADLKTILSLHDRFSKSNRFFTKLRSTRAAIIDPSYLELVLENQPKAFLFTLFQGQALEHIIESVAEISFWYFLITGEVSLATEALSSWSLQRETKTNTSLVGEVISSLLPIVPTQQEDLLQIAELLNNFGVSYQQVIQFISSVLQKAEDPISEKHLEFANYELQYRQDKQVSGILNAVTEKEFANETLPESFWNTFPHDFLPRKLIVKILETMASKQPPKKSEVLDYIVTNYEIEHIDIDLFLSERIDIETKRQLFEHLKQIHNVALENGRGYHVHRLLEAAAVILPKEDVEQLVWETYEKVLSLDDAGMQRSAIKDLCGVVAKWDSREALNLAESQLEDEDLGEILTKISREDPHFILDYTLQNAEHKGKVYVMLGAPVYSAFFVALRALDLSVEELRNLKSKVIVISHRGDDNIIGGLIVRKLLEEDKLIDAINFVEKECIHVLPDIVNALVESRNWADIERLRQKYYQAIQTEFTWRTQQNYNTVLYKLVSGSISNEPERVLHYLEIIDDYKTRYGILRRMINSPEFIPHYPGGKTALVAELLDTAYAIGNEREAINKNVGNALDVVINLLPPAESAKIILTHKQVSLSNIERIMLWAEKAHSTLSTEELINISVQTADKADTIISEVF